MAEVNNTFGERYVYVLDHGLEGQGTRIPLRKGWVLFGRDAVWCYGPVGSLSAHAPPFRSAPLRSARSLRYTHAHILPRTFHVSPFNPRSGFYAFQLRSPLEEGGNTDIAIIYWASSSSSSSSTSQQQQSEEPSSPSTAVQLQPPFSYSQLASTHSKTIHARLYSQSSHPLSTSTLLTTLFLLPMTAFLTVPRIMYQAWCLHYNLGLPIWGRPPPIKRGRGQGTITWTGVEEVGDVESWLLGKGVGVVKDWMGDESSAVVQEGEGKVVLRLHAPELFGELAVHSGTGRDAREPWIVSYVRGDFDTDDLVGLFKVLESQGGEKGEATWAGNLASCLWPSTQLVAPNSSLLSQPTSLPFSTHLSSTLSSFSARFQLDTIFATKWTYDTSSRAVYQRCLEYAIEGKEEEEISGRTGEEKRVRERERERWRRIVGVWEGE